MASTAQIAAQLSGFIDEMFPGADALVVDRVRRATTVDGRVRADRVIGRLAPTVSGIDGLSPEPLVESEDLNFPSIAAGRTADLTITVTGAVVNDKVTLGPPVLAAGLCPFGFVSAASTVTIRLLNATAAAIDPGAQTWTVWVG